eukprot:TRINITY_DN34188_c0_g1_i1.p1 TRINITY_DN34188_c0_g1~~TRINITY_DN34188_c0_g1_i1.p1  ORF type:complete len:482 (-),score=64.44 TRINITY_DN34188_c0_g1_i1:73-1443(-)
MDVLWMAELDVHGEVAHESGPAASSESTPLCDGDTIETVDDEATLKRAIQNQAEAYGVIHAVDVICDPLADGMSKKRSLDHLSEFLISCMRFKSDVRRAFVNFAISRDVVAKVVTFIELGGVDLVVSSSNFLADFAFGSEVAADAVQKVFDPVARRFKTVLETLQWERSALLEAVILLCLNMSAMCPSWHLHILPLVQPVCLHIIERPEATPRLRGNTITLLANLSMSAAAELRSLQVARSLLHVLKDDRVPPEGRSVAESVIIYLHGDQKCDEVDELMSMNVIDAYCVPLMEVTLRSGMFREMFPYLVYSARVFQVLAQSRDYAEMLVAHEKVIPLLLQASERQDFPVQVESNVEGRRLSLEALWSLARFGLWPGRGVACELTASFLHVSLPAMLGDSHAVIRGAAAGVWAQVNCEEVLGMLIVGQRLEVNRSIRSALWKSKILSFLFPFLETVA